MLFWGTHNQPESKASPFGAKEHTRDTHHLAGDDQSVEVRSLISLEAEDRIEKVCTSIADVSFYQSRRVEHDTGGRSISIEMCARRPFSVSKPSHRCIDPSIHRIDIHRKNLICGCHTTRGVKQPYTLTEAMRHGGACPSHQRAAQLMGSNWGCDVSSQCVILTYLCFKE